MLIFIVTFHGGDWKDEADVRRLDTTGELADDDVGLNHDRVPEFHEIGGLYAASFVILLMALLSARFKPFIDDEQDSIDSTTRWTNFINIIMGIGEELTRRVHEISTSASGTSVLTSQSPFSCFARRSCRQPTALWSLHIDGRPHNYLCR